MKHVIALVFLVSLGLFSVPAFAVDFEFHGDFNNNFRLLSSHAPFFAGGGKNNEALGRKELLDDDTSSDMFGNLKYRLWTEVSSDGGAIRGVYAIEFGGTHFGQVTDSKGSDKGGGFSGDGINIETRWAYTDFALAHGRMKVGLQPVKINPFLWNETATGIHYANGAWQMAWYRGYEVVDTDPDGGTNDFKDLDALYLRYTLKPAAGVKLGLFGVWQTSDADTLTDGATAPQYNYLKKLTGYDVDLYTFGVDGALQHDAFFASWDLLYQTGDLAEAFDFGGYLAHVEAGMQLGRGELTYTFWYASGDDNAADGDMDAFMATDCDTKGKASSVVLFEGYTTDDYFSAVPYIQDKGLILNRIGYDYTLSDKLTIGCAALYLMTAEDLGNDTDADGKVDQFGDDSIGFEVDAYMVYSIYPGLEFALQGGYLAAGDAMDFYEAEQDGNADEDIYVINSHLRYKF